MRITADTNLWVRVLTEDDPAQAAKARATLQAATRIAIPTPVLCELVWVLMRGYGVARADVAAAVHGLMNSETVASDRAAVAAGLTVFTAGGDFADGVIAYEGAALGGEVFVSFDEEAVQQARALGMQARAP